MEKYASVVLGILILAGVFILLFKLTKESLLRYAVRIATITIASVMALSFIMGNPAIASPSQGTEEIAQVTAVHEAVPDPTVSSTPAPAASSTPAPSVTPVVIDGIVYANPEMESEKLPNVYCFVLDEYSSAEMLEKYYGFNNSFFINYLKEHRFNISSTTLTNIPETIESFGELHKLEPLPENITKTKARSYRNNNAPLYTSFRDLGYTTYSNCVRSLFKAAALKDHMDALVDLSTLDREPPLTVKPEKTQGTDGPVVEPTPAPTPTERKSVYDDFDEVEVDTDWRDEFFTSHTEKDETMYDLAIEMSVLSLFMEKMIDRGMLDDEEDAPETDEGLMPTAVQPSSSPVPNAGITQSETAGIENDIEDEEEDYSDEEDPEDADQGEEAPLDWDAANDPVPYDELVPIPKRLSVHAHDMYGVLSRLDQLQTKGFAQPTALFIYLRQPHVPFMFDKYGNALSNNVRNYWKNPNYYLGQLKFITTHMMHVIDVLLESDPDCVIIIQSDHGVRWRQMVFPTTATKDKKDQHYVLNYVYYRGQLLDIEGLSPINTYRTVLTRLGLDMPLVEDPRALEFRGQKYGIPDDDPRLNNINQ